MRRLRLLSVQLFRSRGLSLVVALLLGLPLACLYDADDRCGAGQTFVPGTYGLEACTCPSNAALNAQRNGCVECGPNERGAGTLCTCVEGFGRSATTDECEALPDQLGRACEPESDPCGDETYSYCAVDSPGANGYCTARDCTQNDECDEGYACELEASPSYCSAPPTGQGEACGTSADCSGYDAGYCEAFTSKRCLVDNCLSAEVTCHGSWVCCDYGDLLGVSICIPAESLDQGECPSGGQLVSE